MVRSNFSPSDLLPLLLQKKEPVPRPLKNSRLKQTNCLPLSNMKHARLSHQADRIPLRPASLFRVAAQSKTLMILSALSAVLRMHWEEQLVPPALSSIQE